MVSHDGVPKISKLLELLTWDNYSSSINPWTIEGPRTVRVQQLGFSQVHQIGSIMKSTKENNYTQS